jgi:hypothetical protein
MMREYGSSRARVWEKLWKSCGSLVEGRVGTRWATSENGRHTTFASGGRGAHRAATKPGIDARRLTGRFALPFKTAVIGALAAAQRVADRGDELVDGNAVVVVVVERRAGGQRLLRERDRDAPDEIGDRDTAIVAAITEA